MNDQEILDRAERAARSLVGPDDAYEALLLRRDRKRRNQRIVAGLVGIAVFVAAVWLVTTGGPFDRARNSIVPGGAGGAVTGATVTALPTPTERVGFIGLPPVGATPSTPEQGELVLSFWGGTTKGAAARTRLQVYADGRMIWQRDDNLPYGANEVSTEVFTEVCAGGTEEKTGALWFYDISDPTAPVESGWFQLPRPNAEHYCYAHEANVVALPTEKDIVVTGWFGGGVNLVDFTDPTRPVELAYWVSTEPEGEHSFAYSSYWYNGLVYAANTSARGFDVFEVDMPVLSEAVSLPHMNAQTQEAFP